MIDIINPRVRILHIDLQKWINVASREALNSTHVKKVTVGVYAILTSFLLASFLLVVWPCLLRPFSTSGKSGENIGNNFLHSIAQSSSREENLDVFVVCSVRLMTKMKTV